MPAVEIGGIRHYSAQVIVRDRNGGPYYYVVVARRSFRTAARAARWLERKVPPVHCSRFTFWDEWRRSGWGDVVDRKRKRVVQTVEPEVFEHPAVSDLGIIP